MRRYQQNSLKKSCKILFTINLQILLNIPPLLHNSFSLKTFNRPKKSKIQLFISMFSVISILCAILRQSNTAIGNKTWKKKFLWSSMGALEENWGKFVCDHNFVVLKLIYAVKFQFALRSWGKAELNHKNYISIQPMISRH